MPTLRESQNFFYHLMAKPETVGLLRRNRAKTLRRFFKSEADRAALMKVPLERLETYRKHVSVGLLGGIEDAFPVIRSLVTHDEWNTLLNDFYLKRLTKSPIARQVFREFAHYLSKLYRGPLLRRLPYLRELAEYENLDLKLLYDIDQPAPHGLIKDLESLSENPQKFLKLKPFLNPHHDLKTYAWPVHRITEGYSTPRQVKKKRTDLLVYRDPESLRIRFIETNALVVELVSGFTNGKTTIEGVLKKLLARHRPEDPSAFAREAVAAIRSLKELGIVLGFRES